MGRYAARSSPIDPRRYPLLRLAMAARRDYREGHSKHRVTMATQPVLCGQALAKTDARGHRHGFYRPFCRALLCGTRTRSLDTSKPDVTATLLLLRPRPVRTRRRTLPTTGTALYWTWLGAATSAPSMNISTSFGTRICEDTPNRMGRTLRYRKRRRTLTTHHKIRRYVGTRKFSRSPRSCGWHWRRGSGIRPESHSKRLRSYIELCRNHVC